MVRYPHILKICVTGTAQATGGNTVQPQTEMIFYSNCRLRVNSGGRKMALGGGQVIVYDGEIILPSYAPSLPVGTLVQVLHASDVLIEKMVLRYHQNQKGSKLWV